jgi:polar amino acid transport system substrate-binding protein
MITITKALVSAILVCGLSNMAAADKLDEIKARGKLLIGNSETSPPFSSRENGKVVGYDIDLASHVAKKLGVPMEFVPVINAERIPALQQDRIDLAASGMTRADNRRHLVGFSITYLNSPHTVIIRKDSGITTVKQMAGKKLALVKGASVDAELKEAVPTMQIVHYDTYALCFDAVRDKQVSGFLADEVLLWAYAQKSGAPGDYMMIPDYDLPRTAGFAIKKDEPRFTKFVDDVLLDLEKSGEAEKIFNTWFAPVKRPFKITAD